MSYDGMRALIKKKIRGGGGGGSSKFNLAIICKW